MSYGTDCVFRVASDVRIASDQDGAVVVDLRSGKYLALNPIGSAVLLGMQGGKSLDAIASELSAQCKVPLDRVTADAERFFAQLLSARLIERASGGRPSISSEGLTGIVSGPSEPVSAEKTLSGPVRTSVIWVVSAYLCFIAVDASFRLLGFGRVYRLLRRYPSRGSIPDLRSARALVRAIDRAAAFYFKRAWCLERSLVAVFLMRVRRWPALLVLGAKRMPFEAHAWVELGGDVINDDARSLAQYAVLERC
jgi:hypothetical protein